MDRLRTKYKQKAPPPFYNAYMKWKKRLSIAHSKGNRLDEEIMSFAEYLENYHGED